MQNLIQHITLPDSDILMFLFSIMSLSLILFGVNSIRKSVFTFIASIGICVFSMIQAGISVSVSPDHTPTLFIVSIVISAAGFIVWAHREGTPSGEPAENTAASPAQPLTLPKTPHNKAPRKELSTAEV